MSLYLTLFISIIFSTILVSATIIPTDHMYAIDSKFQKIDGIYAGSFLTLESNLQLIPNESGSEEQKFEWEEAGFHNVLALNLLKRVRDSKVFLQLKTINDHSQTDVALYNENSIALGYAISDKGFESEEDLSQDYFGNEAPIREKPSPSIILLLVGLTRLERAIGDYPQFFTKNSPFVGVRFEGEEYRFEGSITYRQGEKVLPIYTYTEGAKTTSETIYNAELEVRDIGNSRVSLGIVGKTEHTNNNFQKKILIIIPTVALLKTDLKRKRIKTGSDYSVSPSLNLNFPVRIIKNGEKSSYSLGVSLSGGF